MKRPVFNVLTGVIIHSTNKI